MSGTPPIHLSPPLNKSLVSHRFVDCIVLNRAAVEERDPDDQAASRHVRT